MDLMGFNGTFLCVCAERHAPAQIAAAIERYYLARGYSLVSHAPLTCSDWRSNRCLHGFAISPAVSGWSAVADTENTPSKELAAFLALELQTPVVISTIFDICDPPEPERIQVYGAPLDARFWGLYELVGFRYRDLEQPQEHFFPQPPFDPAAIVFLTLSGDREHKHWDDLTGA